MHRRDFLQMSASATAALALGRPANAGDGPAELPWEVGTGRAEITPPLEAGILMSSSLRRWEPFQGVRLPLLARALVIQQGSRRVGLVSLDLLGLAGEAIGGWQAFTNRVAAAAGGSIEPRDLVFACSHTHSGPESIDLTDLCHTAPFRGWVDLLVQRIGEALAAAAKRLRPCALKTAIGVLPGLSVNRRVLVADERGSVSVRRARPTDKVVGPEGPVDEKVRVAALLDGSGRAAAILVQATAHPVYEMCIKQVSPDYPGELVRDLQRRHPESEVLFLQGAAGNINPPVVSAGAAKAEQHGRLLAEEVQRLLGQLQPVRGRELSFVRRDMKLPARTATGEPQEEPIVAALSVLRLGSAAWVFLPGEPFVEIGLAILKDSPFPFTAVAGYCDAYVGYIPTDRAMTNGGYETVPRRARFRAGTQQVICREAAELLREAARTAGVTASRSQTGS